jgi:tetratricopeptide (TPR) repeat protein
MWADESAEPEWTDMTFDDYNATQPVATMPDDEFFEVDDGWSLLIAGNLNEALRAFSRSMADNPMDALSQVGYAISAAAMGRHDGAAENMRQAVTLDAQALWAVPESESLLGRYALLLARYQSIIGKSPAASDARFMAAVMQTLQGKYESAYFTIDDAIDYGNAGPGALELKRLLQSAIRETAQPELMPPPPAPATEPVEPLM